MELRKFIATTIREYLEENVKSTNLKLGGTYPDVHLEPMGKKSLAFLGGDIGFDIINKVNNEEIGAVIIREIDGVKNVIHSIFINPEFRGKSFGISTYIKLAQTLGFICSGEYRNDVNLTSFVSKDADKIWKRLSEIYTLEKLPIQGNRFRFCLNGEK